MNEDTIQISDRSDVVSKGQQMLSDQRIGRSTPTLSEYCTRITTTLKVATRHGYFWQWQIDSMERMWDTYQNIVKLNESLDGQIVHEVESLLREARELADPIKGDPDVTAQKRIASTKANQVKKGEYIWYVHLYPVNKLVSHLKAADIDTSSLEQRSEALSKKLNIEY